MDKILRSPTFEMKIHRAVFINQDILVFPHRKKMPDNLSDVVKFLFGEGAVVTQDCVNNSACIIIEGANYVLNNVKTLSSEWEFREVKDEHI